MLLLVFCLVCVAKVTVVWAIAGLVAVCLRRASAASRHFALGCRGPCVARAAPAHIGASRLEIDDSRASRGDSDVPAPSAMRCTAGRICCADENRCGGIDVSRGAISDCSLGDWRARFRHPASRGPVTDTAFFKAGITDARFRVGTRPHSNLKVFTNRPASPLARIGESRGDAPHLGIAASDDPSPFRNIELATRTPPHRSVP